MSTNRVTLMSKLTAVSSRPIGQDQNHPFTALDHAMGLHSLHVIFYYKDNIFKDFDLDPLRVSLSEVLSIYPSVTGRLHRDPDGNWGVTCNDAGVRVLRAQVGTTFDEWLRSADGVEERNLTVWDDMPDDPKTWSPVQIQVNEFEGGGIAIGLSCPHMHADPTCLTLLMKSWSEAHCGKAITHPPFFSSTALKGPYIPNLETKAAAYYTTKSITQVPSINMASTTFKFSHETIHDLLLEIQESYPNVTPFDILAGLFWTSIARLKSSKYDQKLSLSICMDFRKKMHASLPLGYYGNALHFSRLSLDKEELGSGGLGHVAQVLHSHLSSIEEEELWSAIDWLESQKGEGQKFGPPFRMYGPELTCINMEHMIGPSGPIMYTTTFDKDARPMHVSYHVGNVEGEGLIMVIPSSDGGLGRVVTVTLPEKELAELCEDQAILYLKPIMLLSGKH